MEIFSTGGATAGVHLLGWEAVNHTDDISFQQSGCGENMVLNPKIPVFDRNGDQVYGDPFIPIPDGGIDQVEILSGPDDLTVVQGQDASFTVNIVSTVNYSLQWLRNGAVIEGAVGTSFVEPKVGMSKDGTTYQVIVWVNGAKKASRVATLHVTPKNLAPVFDVQPKDLVVRAGMEQPARFFAHAIDPMGGVVSYQWYVNGQAVTGETSQDFVRNTVSLGQNGQLIHVVATGAGGSTRSRTVALKVLPFVVPSQRVTLVGRNNQRKGGTPLYIEHFREEAMRPIASEGRFSVQLGTGDASETLANLTKTRETLYAEIRFGAGTVQELAPERIPFTAISYTKGVAP